MVNVLVGENSHCWPSEHLSNVFVSCNAGTKEGADEPLPLNKVNAHILAKVLEYMKAHYEKNPNVVDGNEHRLLLSKEELVAFDDNFMQNHEQDLFGILNVGPSSWTMEVVILR